MKTTFKDFDGWSYAIIERDNCKTLHIHDKNGWIDKILTFVHSECDAVGIIHFMNMDYESVWDMDSDDIDYSTVACC